MGTAATTTAAATITACSTASICYSDGSVLPATGLGRRHDGVPCSHPGVPAPPLLWSHGGPRTSSCSSVLPLRCRGHAPGTTTSRAQRFSCVESRQADADDPQPGLARDSRGSTSAWSLYASSNSTACCSSILLDIIVKVHSCRSSPTVQVEIKSPLPCFPTPPTPIPLHLTTPAPLRRQGVASLRLHHDPRRKGGQIYPAAYAAGMYSNMYHR